MQTLKQRKADEFYAKTTAIAGRYHSPALELLPAADAATWPPLEKRPPWARKTATVDDLAWTMTVVASLSFSRSNPLLLPRDRRAEDGADGG
jgi:hypothetical protein